MTDARLRFESQFARKLHERHQSRRLPLRFATAAAILLAIGGGTFAFIHHQNQSRLIASTETIDQAVGFNLSLGESNSETERQQLYTQGFEDLQHKADHTSIGDEDRAFADHLIASAKFLTDHREPLAQADHFTQMAEQLVTRMDVVGRKNPKALGHLSQAYFNVMNKGVHRNLDLAAADLQSPEAQHRLDKLLQRNLALHAKLEAMLRDHPDQQQLRKQLDQVEHRLHRLQLKAASTQPGTPAAIKRSPIR